MKFTTEKIIKVQFYDLDPMNVVWHGNYVKYLETARCDLLDKLGYNYMDMREDGVAYPVATMEMKYISPCTFNQELRIVSTIEEIEPALIIKYTIFDNETGKKLFKAKSMQICVDVTTMESKYEAPETLKKKHSVQQHSLGKTLKSIVLIAFLFISTTSAFASDDVFNYKISPENISIPQFRNVVCKFEQEKNIPNSNATIKSGGNFQFEMKKGVVFETLYPVKYTTTYDSKENKYVNDIILGITKKKFSQIEKNFDTYFQKQGTKWVLGLIPKVDTPAATQLKNIVIAGERDINKIIISTLSNGETKLNFSQCK